MHSDFPPPPPPPPALPPAAGLVTELRLGIERRDRLGAERGVQPGTGDGRHPSRMLPWVPTKSFPFLFVLFLLLLVVPTSCLLFFLLYGKW